MGLTKPRAAQIFNLDYKQSTRVVTVSDITLSGGAPTVVDGVTLVKGDRVLVTGQGTGSQNGLYLVSTLGTGNNGTWTRTSDSNETGEIESGMIVMVTEGNVYADTQWKLITNDPITVGTTALVFTQNYSANSISGGTSNVVVYSNSAVTISSSGTANVVSVENDDVTFIANLIPSANVTYDLGSATNRWKDLWLSNNTIYLGNVTLGATAQGLTVDGNSVLTAGAGGNVISVSGNITGGNVLASGTVSATGNITGSYIFGNGSQLTGLPQSYSNANVASFLAAYGSNTISSTGTITAGNITGGNILTTGMISTGGNIFGGNAVLSGNLTVNGNVTYVNSNVVTINDLAINLANNASNVAQVNGGGFELGPQGSPFVTFVYNNSANTLTSSVGLSAVGNILGGNISTAGLISATGNISGGNATVTTQINTASVSASGNIRSAGTVSATGNIDAGNIRTGGLISATGSITGASVAGGTMTGTSLSVSGGVTAASVAGGVITGTSTSVTGTQTAASTVGGVITGTSTSVTGTQTAASTVGGVITGSSVSVSGAVTAASTVGGVITGSSASVSGTVTAASTVGGVITGTSASVSGTVTGASLAGTITTAAQTNITSVGTLSSLSVTANVQAGNVATGGTISATGAITGASVVGGVMTGTSLSVSGTVTAASTVGGVITGSSTSVTGTQTAASTVGGVITGSSASLSGTVTAASTVGGVITGSSASVSGTVTAASTVGGVITGSSASLSGNVSGGNLNVTGNIVDTGPLSIITGSNGNIALAPNGTGIVTASGNISAVGNIAGSFFIGNGSQLTGISAGGGTSLVNGTSNVVVAASGNVSVGVGGTNNIVVFSTSGIDVTGRASASGNVTGGNILTSGLISATGTVTGSSFSGAGTGLTGTAASLTVATAQNPTFSNDSASAANVVTRIDTGFYQSSTANTATGYPVNSNNWQHLISCTHSNDGNYYALQLAATFFDQGLYYRSTNGSGSTAWSTIALHGTTPAFAGITNSGANGVGNIGSASTYFNTVFAKATSAQYADLAEMYVADSEYSPGTVIEFGGNKEVTQSSVDHSTRVAGIVSTNPSYLMNATQTGEHVVAVALIGRVPCRVIGTIAKGDRLVASHIPGVAGALDPAKYQPACIIGKALENYDSDQPGVIEVAVGRT